jgi:hypothetical protein
MMPALLEKRLATLEAAILPRPSVEVPDACTLMRETGIEPDVWQMAVTQSASPRVLLNCSRQSGKTLLAAAVALSTAMAQPGALVLVLSPSLRQSQESFRQVLDLYRPWTNTVPPSAESALRLELHNASRIVSLPGQESSIRGYSKVALLVCDEASRIPDELFYAVRPMVAISQGRILALSTPFGRRGWWHKAWTEGLGWERIQIDATMCPRISTTFLEEERRSLPRLWYLSEYCCEFVDTTDQLFGYDLVHAALSDVVVPLFADTL